MKRIVFLIIASLMVLGLILPGCTVTGYIRIAVCGPMTELQGQDMWNAANMAATELNLQNSGQGILATNGIYYQVQLVPVETKECDEGEDGSTGTANLTAVIDDVHFCVGGVRPEAVAVYREVAMDAGRIFMDCCAANASLQFNVVTDYAKYQYWLKSSPLNQVFLSTSLFKMTGTIGGILKEVLQNLEQGPGAVQDDYKVSNAVNNKLRVEILADSATSCCCFGCYGGGWHQGIVAAAQDELSILGFNVTGTTLVSPTASDISAELSAIKARNPHIIFTAFCGSVGAVYSTTKADLEIPAMTIGVNTAGQRSSHWVNTSGACEGEIMLDTWAVNLSNTDKTTAWFEEYVNLYGSYPVCCAATYDAVMALVQATVANGFPLSPILVPWLEDPTNKQTGVAGTTAYYPVPAITLSPGARYALNETQVRALYNINSYGYVYSQSDWLCTPAGADGPHIAHDLVYGPGYQTGIGSQWQACGVGGIKVGIWPKDMTGFAGQDQAFWDTALTDQYGNWNFEYPGTAKLILPIGGMLNIPWDMCANAI